MKGLFSLWWRDMQCLLFRHCPADPWREQIKAETLAAKKSVEQMTGRPFNPVEDSWLGDRGETG